MIDLGVDIRFIYPQNLAAGNKSAILSVLWAMERKFEDRKGKKGEYNKNQNESQSIVIAENLRITEEKEALERLFRDVKQKIEIFEEERDHIRSSYFTFLPENMDINKNESVVKPLMKKGDEKQEDVIENMRNIIINLQNIILEKN